MSQTASIMTKGEAVNRATLRRAAPSGRYLVAMALLLAAAVAIPVLPSLVGVYTRKEPVPLKEPLEFFDVAKLGPRYVPHPEHLNTPPLSDDVLDSLGTREYVQAWLVDTEAGEGSPVQNANLFVTYYTGKPNLVPHVPEECFLASGWELLDAMTAEVPVEGVGAPDGVLPVRVLRFRAARATGVGGEQTGVITVLYFFHANGGYATTRDGVRLKLANPFARYAYYSKIEVTFPQTMRLSAAEGRAASIAALQPLIAKVLPILLRDHFDLTLFTEAASENARLEPERG